MLFRVTYVPVVDRPPIRLIEAACASEAAAQVYPDADLLEPVQVRRVYGEELGADEPTRPRRAGTSEPPESRA